MRESSGGLAVTAFENGGGKLLVAPSNETFIRMRRNQRRGCETGDGKIDSTVDCVNRPTMGTNFRWG
jgi:hypothetical protein